DGRLYYSAGSTCNFCLESDARRAAVTRFESDGTGESLFARGLRNTVGMAFHPSTGELWSVDNGGDGLGDNDPPEEINILREGADYGWPDCRADRLGVNWGLQARPSRCGPTEPPAVQLPAHSAPLGISFYSGEIFPSSWRDNAIVGLHGSWNRSQPTGYKVVRIGPGGVEDLLTGCLDSASRTTSCRPVHAVTGSDGALYVSDDMQGQIYRIAYLGPRINPGGIVAVIPRVYELYGRNLAADPSQFAVYANGVQAELLYASPGQVNFVLPEGISGEVTIAVKNERAVDQVVINVE
ncbi:MAG: PQQ-dependent sugar dehydrogenase, partial [Bryobacteraceae bacterium]